MTDNKDIVLVEDDDTEDVVPRTPSPVPTSKYVKYIKEQNMAVEQFDVYRDLKDADATTGRKFRDWVKKLIQRNASSAPEGVIVRLNGEELEEFETRSDSVPENRMITVQVMVDDFPSVMTRKRKREWADRSKSALRARVDWTQERLDARARDNDLECEPEHPHGK